MNIDRDKLHLLHMQDALEKIKKYSKGMTLESFSKSEETFDAVMMQMIVVGESVNRLSADFKEKHDELPWYQAVGLRNQMAHGYFDIKPEIVWQTAKEDLPNLNRQVKDILEKY